MKDTDRFYAYSEDFREPFARDRDRIIHSSSFRRLEYKTQVFLNLEGDYFRTRLTHSLEVSQIARVIASHCKLDSNLSEAIALAHDLGHSPFGHVGGDELDKILKENGAKSGFEHNFQSFRVVTKLEKRYEHCDGLNLTFATLEGILKHSTPYDKAFITPELKEIFDVSRPPRLEAQIVDFSDEIAYCSHDIDDGIKQGLISFDIFESNALARRIFEQIENISRSDDIFRYRFISSLINALIENLIKNFNQTREIAYDDEVLKGLREIKDILYNNLYCHENIKRKMHFGKICVRNLFNDFMSDKQLLPRDLRDKIERGAKHHRIVADYIAGMTDRYAIKLYKELHIG